MSRSLPATRLISSGYLMAHAAFDLQYLDETVKRMAAANKPTSDDFSVACQSDQVFILRVDFHGHHPITGKPVTVTGYGDRHYRAVKAAERAWYDLHAMALIEQHKDPEDAPHYSGALYEDD